MQISPHISVSSVHISLAKNGNWDFLCDVLQKLTWWTDVTEGMTTAKDTFALCASNRASHQKFHETCMAPFLQHWQQETWKQSREDCYGTLKHWIDIGAVTKPEQVKA